MMKTIQTMMIGVMTMVGKALKKLWSVIDLVLLLLSFAFIIWGFFLINLICGVFAIGGALLILAIITEYVAGLEEQDDQ